MIAWFICPYKRKLNARRPTRYCEMDDFTPQIVADGGEWSEVEVLGNRAVVKVRASSSTLQQIATTPEFRRLPKERLTDPLSDLPGNSINTLRSELIDAGYPNGEVQSRLGDLSQRTLGDFLQFMATRRLKPRYDRNSDAIILDGPIQQPGSISQLDRRVR